MGVKSSLLLDRVRPMVLEKFPHSSSCTLVLNLNDQSEFAFSIFMRKGYNTERVS